jgi:hypothetical protein
MDNKKTHYIRWVAFDEMGEAMWASNWNIVASDCDTDTLGNWINSLNEKPGRNYTYAIEHAHNFTRPLSSWTNAAIPIENR